MPKERASQAALLIDGRLEDLFIDPPKWDGTPVPGEIYQAKVDRLVPGIGGVFVKLTPKHMGFLRETKGVKAGATLNVQVSSYPEPGKAFPVATRLLYKGYRLIYTPGAPGINVSRQIRDAAERDRLTGILRAHIEEQLSEISDDGPVEGVFLKAFRDGGFILRSSAEGAAADELIEELGRVVARAVANRGDLEDRFPMNARQWAFDQFIREWCHPLPTRIIAGKQPFRVLSRIRSVEGLPSLPEWGEFCSMDLHARLTEERGDVFEAHGIWDEIERLKSPRVELPSGGWMAIEATRAMVTVDVNTGDQFSEGAAMTANVEAARELPRQLRLRGLGGQVIVDFAPLKKMHRKQIEETLKTAFRRDPIQTTLAGWTPLGNFELQRKRERRPLDL